MSRVLRTEQVKAISTLASREDLFAVLPTGFGKSLIFQLLVRVVECLTGKASCVLVVCSLKSIIQDQLAEATSLEIRDYLRFRRRDSFKALPLSSFSPPPPHSSLLAPFPPLREFQHGAFASKTIQAPDENACTAG